MTGYKSHLGGAHGQEAPEGSPSSKHARPVSLVRQEAHRDQRKGIQHLQSKLSVIVVLQEHGRK